MTNIVFKLAVLYLRASTNKQGQKWETLENQEEACLNYCNSKNIRVVKIFREQFTWTVSNRPQLSELKKYIKKSKSKIDYCIILKIDRATRWWIKVYEEVKDAITKLDVKLRDTYWVIQDDIDVVKINWIDTSKYDWATENPWRYAESMQAMVSEDERNSILRRTIPQSIRNAQRGYQKGVFNPGAVLRGKRHTLGAAYSSRSHRTSTGTIESSWNDRGYRRSGGRRALTEPEGG